VRKARHHSQLFGKANQIVATTLEIDILACEWQPLFQGSLSFEIEGRPETNSLTTDKKVRLPILIAQIEYRTELFERELHLARPENLAEARHRFENLAHVGNPSLGAIHQGIPALSWVVIAIIWFHGIEFRIFFIMVMTTLPAFTFQILDAFRSMSKDLFEMTMSFRPRRWTLFRVLIVPTIVPGILTAWKVNLGNAARVVVVAELVGATGGVGYELLRQQQLFDMAGAIAWTLQLVLFVLVVQQTITAIETWALRYRAVSERAM